MSSPELQAFNMANDDFFQRPSAERAAKRIQAFRAYAVAVGSTEPEIKSATARLDKINYIILTANPGTLTAAAMCDAMEKAA